MFVILSKFLPLFFYPLGIACILLILALVFRRKEKFTAFLIAGALLILWLSSTSLVANTLARTLEWQFLPAQEIPHADAAIVLGGGTDAKVYPRPDVEINGAGDRVYFAAKLYKEGKINQILLSGGEITWLSASGSTPAGEMATILEELGIPKAALWLEDQSQNTHENAVFAKKILDEKGIQRVLLITSAMHMPRAVGLFKKLGVEVIPISVDYSVTQADFSFDQQDLMGKMLGFLPSSSSLSATTNALKEYIGIMVYQLRGWM
jgi:uncharacterized SAM-binding protein YcdF (DUF218 family)